MNALGQAARRSTLLRFGITREQIDTALNVGFLGRPIRGWYITEDADSDQRRAIVAGARIGCVSALRRWGAWSGPDNDLHLHCAPTASRLRLRLDQASAVLGQQPVLPHPSVPRWRTLELDGIWSCAPGPPVVHWLAQASGAAALDWIVSPADALAQAVRCQDAEHAVACIDSVLRHGVLSAAEWARILPTLPERLQPLAHLVDGRADSGNETIVRLRLRSAGMQVELQTQMPGIGAVDLVVGGLVSLEIDGDRFHSSKEQRRKDRTRTLLSQAYGMPSVRIGSEHLSPDEWPLALSALQRQVSDADKLRRLRTGSRLARD